MKLYKHIAKHNLYLIILLFPTLFLGWRNPLQEEQVEKKWIRLGIIEVSRKSLADSIIILLQGGESFEKIARYYSIHSSAKDGGDIGWFETDGMDEGFKSALELKPAGSFSSIIPKGNYFFIIHKFDELYHNDYLLCEKKSSELKNIIEKIEFFFANSSYKEVLNLADQAEKLSCDLGEKEIEMSVYHMKGTALFVSAEYDSAIKVFENLIKKAISVGKDRWKNIGFASLAKVYGTQGEIYEVLGLEDLMIANYNSALVFVRKYEHKPSEINYLKSLGEIYFDSNQFSKAIVYFDSALVIAHDIGARESESMLLGSLGLSFLELEDFTQSAALFEQAVSAEKSRPNINQENLLKWTFYAGYSLFSIGEIEKGVAFYDQAYPLAVELNNREIELKMTIDLVDFLYYNLNNEVIKVLQYGLEIAEQLQDTSSVRTLMNKSEYIFDRFRGREDDKLDFYMLAISKYGDYIDMNKRIQYQIKIAELYYLQKDYANAITFYKKTLESADKNQNNEELTNCCILLGDMYNLIENYEMAVEYFKSALPYAQKTNNKQLIFEIFSKNGRTLMLLNNFRLSLNYFEKSLQIAKQLRDIDKIAETLINMGFAYQSMGREDDADNKFKESLKIAPFFEGNLKIRNIIKSESDKERDYPDLVVQTGLTSLIRCVAISPNDKLVAACEKGTGYIKFWDLSSGKEFKALSRSGEITALCFSPDGKELTALNSSNIAYLIDPMTGNDIKMLTDYGKIDGIGYAFSGTREGACAFSKNGLIAATAIDDVKMWRQNGEEYGILPGDSTLKSDDISVLDFSHDGNLLAIGRYPYIEVWDVENSRICWRGESEITQINLDSISFAELSKLRHSQNITDISFNIDGKFLAAALKHKIQIWDVESRQMINELIHDNFVEALVFSNDGEELYSVGQNSYVTMWNWQCGTVKERIDTGHASLSGIYPFHEKELFIITSGNSIEIWDLQKQKILKSLNRQTQIIPSMALYKENNSLITCSPDGILLWNLNDGKLIRNYKDFNGTAQSVKINTTQDKMVIHSIVEENTNPSSKHVNSLTLVNLPSLEKLWSVSLGEDDLTCLSFSPDEKLLAYLMNRDKVCFINLLNGEKTANLTIADDFMEQYKENLSGFSSQSKKLKFQRKNLNEDIPALIFCIDYAKIGNNQGIISIGGPNVSLYQNYNTRIDYWTMQKEKPHKIAELRAHGPVNEMALSSNCEFLACCSSPEWEQVYNISLKDNIMGSMLYVSGGASSLAFNHIDHSLAVGTQTGEIQIWDLKNSAKLSHLKSSSSLIHQLLFNEDAKTLINSTWNGGIQLWDLNKSALRATMYISGNGNIFVAENNYYYASDRRVLKELGFRVKNRVYPFEQFDLKYNRPDIIMERLGRVSPELITAYNQAFKKRLKKMNFTEEMLNEDFHIPEISIIKSDLIPLVTTDKLLNFRIKAIDAKYLLDRLNVFVNDVPIYGTNGLDLRNRKVSVFESEISLELCIGRNKVQVSVLNEKGAESLKETFEITYDGELARPDLYLVTIGVSQYSDNRFNLDYAAKDARDLINILENQQDRFAHVHKIEILDNRVTKENILAIKDKLMNSKVDDEVVLFISGHGLLDDNLDYYFATSDIDFTNPTNRGLPYEEIEGLLDGIPARKKLLLMDTCHSGELDKEDTELDTSSQDGSKNVTIKSFRNVIPISKSRKLGLSNSFQLMQELFANLSRGSGAVVISAAAGVEFAIEDEKWQNGVFTYCLLEGLKIRKADSNGNGEIRVSELKEYVMDKVQELTNGRQTPTSRRENLEFDFRVY